MFKKTKKFLAGILSCTMVISMLPNLVVSADVTAPVEKYQYVLFAGGDGESLKLSTSGFCINGSIHTNGKFVTNATNANVNGQITATNGFNILNNPNLQNKIKSSENQETIIIKQKIMNTYFTSNCDVSENTLKLINNNVNLKKSAYSKDSVIAKGNMNFNAALGALNSIDLSGDSLNANNSTIYSENGNINFKFNNATLTGLIYAPNGKVTIDSNNFQINGTIIAKEIEIKGQNINLNYNDNVAKFIGKTSEQVEVAYTNLSDGKIETQYLNKIIYPKLIEKGISTKNILLSDDYDNDGLTLIEEYNYDTNPFSADTDDDGLNDCDEVKVYKTNAFYWDTDSDGMSDGTEVSCGLNPLLPDSNSNGVLDNEEVVTQNVRIESVNNINIEQTLVKPQVQITGKGDFSKQLYVEDISYDKTITDINCLVGHPFDFVHENALNFESSKLTFALSNKVLQENNLEDLAIAWYNEETNSLEILDTTYDDINKSISANVEHYSKYFVINKPIFNFSLNANTSNNDYINKVILDNKYKTKWGTNNNHTYAFIDDLSVGGLDWTTADEFAKSVGGHLVSITNEDEQKFVTNLVSNGGTKSTYWIGLSNPIGDNKSWEWVTGEPFSYCNWGAGEPNSLNEKWVHLVNTNDAPYPKGSWNDTLNNYTQGGQWYSNSNCGIIIEWDVFSCENDGTTILLTNGNRIKLDIDPNLGDESVDTDKDGIPDLIELDKKIIKGYYDYSLGKTVTYEEWSFYSNPTKEDTDGDGLSDIEDLNPSTFDVRIVDNSDGTKIEFNTGHIWNKLNGFTAEQALDLFNAGAFASELTNKVWNPILENEKVNYNFEELCLIGINDNEGSKLVLDGESASLRENIFKTLYKRDTKFYKHTGMGIEASDWTQVSSYASGGYFKGKVLSEADMNLSRMIYTSKDIYDDCQQVLTALAAAGVVIIAAVTVYYIGEVVVPVVARNIQVLSYYCKEFGIKNGIGMYYNFGSAGVPNGVISVLQMDLQNQDNYFKTIIDEAESNQGGNTYTDIDKWGIKFLPKGTKVYGGEPGQTGFYTTEETMQVCGTDATKIFKGLQVDLGNHPLYRKGMTEYVLTKDTYVAYSHALANTQFGNGGFAQYYISNNKTILEPIKTILLTNR